MPTKWIPCPEYTRGPVKLRRGSIPQATTDQHLLDARPHDGWTHTDPWRVLRIQAEFVEAFDTLATLGQPWPCSAARGRSVMTRST